MFYSGTIAPKRLQRVFTQKTWILIQVKGAATLTIGHDQSEATGGGGGQELTAANTGGTTSQPFGTWWQGEFWYSTTVDNTQFAVTVPTDL